MVSPPFLRLGLLTLLLFSPVTDGEPDLSSDRAALLAFRASVGRISLGWNSTDSPCVWHGVGCVENRVVSLHLPAEGLIGEIPAGTIGNLTALRTLSLRFNGLSGTLPEDLHGATQLRNLYLQDNRFSGEIPSALFSLQKLVRLNLAGNGFIREISPAFGNLSHLRTLYLQRNQLSGAIPDFILPNLVQLNVSFNRLNGSIPSRLWKFPASAFIGTSVCGGPLPPCPNDILPGLPTKAEGPGSGGDHGGTGGRKLSRGAIIGIAVGSAVALVIALILLFLLCRRTCRSKTRDVEASAVSVNPPDTPDGGMQRAVAGKKDEIGKRLVFFGRIGAGEFDLEDLLRASAEVLGKGTFGTVYKAALEVGAVVAVKRLRDANIAEDAMREKIEAVGSLNHENLVPLRAYYYSKNEKLLVYDYMPMGSLSALLHGSRGSGGTPPNWETRLSIALSVARGIDYIHSTGPTASHGNIKSSNILLTKSLNARVSDHGLAALMASSSAVKRAAGYRAPELADSRKVSQKADVYGFGVLVLELLTGKDPSHGDDADLPRWVESVVREEWSTEVFDPELIRQRNAEAEMVKLLQLALDCTAQHPDSRPSMLRVVARIEGISSASGGDAKIEEHRPHQVEPSGSESVDDQFSQRTNAGEDS